MTIDTPRPDWRKNVNLANCFKDCVEMFRAISAPPLILKSDSNSRILAPDGQLRQRREALGIGQAALGMAAGYKLTGAASVVSRVEAGLMTGETARWRIEAALDRLEAEAGRPVLSPRNQRNPTP